MYIDHILVAVGISLSLGKTCEHLRNSACLNTTCMVIHERKFLHRLLHSDGLLNELFVAYFSLKGGTRLAFLVKE